MHRQRLEYSLLSLTLLDVTTIWQRQHRRDVAAADRSPQTNVYLAAHGYGWPNTESRLLFFNLNKLGRGDEIVLKNRQGKTYRYRVSETLVVDLNDRWVMGQVVGKHMLTLQTCTPIPTFEKRLIVRADRV